MKLGHQRNYHKGKAYCGVNAHLAQCLNSVLNVKAVVAAFNQEKAIVEAFSVIVKPMDRFTALLVPSHIRRRGTVAALLPE